MKKTLFVLAALIVVASMVLTACGGKATETVVTKPTEKPTEKATEKPTEAPTPVPPVNAVSVRWFVGLGTGTDPAQIAIEQAVADEFNAGQNEIRLTLEVVPYDSAKDTLATQIAANVGPDVIGPVGWSGSNAFGGQWLDFTPYMDQVDQSLFNPALVEMYITGEGQVGLPFAVYPSMTYYNPALFDEAGLNYPPANYGDKYVMPDGSEVEWSYDTVAAISKLLTLDVNGNNSTTAEYDKTQPAQFGFSFVWENSPAYYGAYFTAGSMLQGEKGNYTAVAPDEWKAAWKWVYDGMWGAQPYMATGAVAGSADFGSGNVFQSGKVAMAISPNWYLCCVGGLADAGGTFQLGILPSYNGAPHGRIDADTFRIWKGTKHPDEAFKVVYWLTTVGIDKLIVGSEGNPPAYGAVPSITAKQQPFLDAKAAQFPFVTTWDTMMAGLSYADVPSAEGWMPNYNEAWARLGTFTDLMNNTEALDLDAAIATLEADMTAIFNK